MWLGYGPGIGPSVVIWIRYSPVRVIMHSVGQSFLYSDVVRHLVGQDGDQRCAAGRKYPDASATGRL